MLDGSLNLLNSYTVASIRYLRQQPLFGKFDFSPENILVAIGSNESTVPAVLEVLDPTSGTQIWESPALRGYVPPNGLNFYNLNGNGLQIVFGTSVGMYVTQ